MVMMIIIMRECEIANSSTAASLPTPPPPTQTSSIASYWEDGWRYMCASTVEYTGWIKWVPESDHVELFRNIHTRV